MGTQINTIESPFRFVKGQVTTGTPSSGYVACGAGTLYPVEATLYQISEIFLRCRNTKIEQYEVSMTYGSYIFSSILMEGDPPAQNYVTPDPSSSGWRQFIRRGHSFKAYPSPFAGWLSAHCGSAYQVGDGLDYYDGRDELCLWPPSSIATFSNGFDHESGFNGTFEESPPSTYGAYSRRREGSSTFYFGGRIYFRATPIIAFVGGDSPFSSGVKLYPNIEFGDISQIGFPPWGHGSVGGSAAIDGYAEVVLSSSTLSIPIYLDDTFGSTLVKPPRLRVTEWWPYAKSDGSPAWDANTGLPL